MKVLICDDDELFLSELKKFISEFFKQKKYTNVEIVCYQQGECALRECSDADIAFLDVEMEGVSGIHVGRKLKEINPDLLVFIVTSFGEYLDEAMRFQVFRYLTKPIDKNRLYRNLSEAIVVYLSSNRDTLVEMKDGVVRVKEKNIVYVRSDDRKSEVLLESGRRIHCVSSMKHWRSVLTSKCFIESHRGVIINLRHVSEIKKDKVVLLDGKEEEYLSRRKYAAIKKAYMLYMEAMR